MVVISWIFLGFVAFSVFSALLTGSGSALAAATAEGAKAGIELASSLAGSLCLWTGVGALMEKNGMTAALERLLRPIIGRVFPQAKKDAALRGDLSANICANFLGLGNAATPMGIRAAKKMAGKSGVASDSLCRLIVLNTASIQLIPTNVAAIRAALGCASPFDILPAVWVTSACSAGLGLTMAWVLGKVWRHG